MPASASTTSAPTTSAAPTSAPAAPPAAGVVPPPFAAHARLLAADDDVATVLDAIPAGTVVEVRAGAVERRVVACEDIPAGHKMSMHDMAGGVRVRKYGECIGRLLRDVAAGAWLHDHNLASTALRDPRDEPAWTARVAPPSVEALGEARASVGRAILYDAQEERLWWADAGATPALHALHLGTGRQRAWTMPEAVGALALAASGRLHLAIGATIASFDPAAGAVATLVPPGLPLAGQCVGDAAIDRRGRLWCTARRPRSALRDGGVYRLVDDRQWSREADDLVAPAGLVFDAAGTTLYVADTRRGVVHAFVVRGDGALGQRRLHADLGTLPGGPVGGTLDADGCTWWALWNGGAVVRLRADGRLDRIVRLPVSRPTSCTFGDAGLSRLFVTSAALGTVQADEPLAGRVLALDVGVAGGPARPLALATT